MDNPTHAELERRFAQHGLSIRKLYPWWYRLYRRIGVKLDPPVLLRLRDHFLYEGSLVVIVCVAGTAYHACCMTSPVWVLSPAYAMIVIAPLLNWWDCRRMRARIGL